MKKLLLLVIVLFAISQTTFAQHRGGKKKKDSYKAYYGFSVGPSIPMGDFAGIDQTKEGQGFAITGIHVALANVGYKIAGPVGLAAQVFIGANRMDVKSIG